MSIDYENHVAHISALDDSQLQNAILELEIQEQQAIYNSTARGNNQRYRTVSGADVGIPNPYDDDTQVRLRSSHSSAGNGGDVREDGCTDESSMVVQTWNVIKTHFKLIILIFLTIYLGIVGSDYSSNDGYIHTRRVGWRRKGYCTDSDQTYSVLPYTANSYPIVFRYDHTGTEELCVSDDFYANCVMDIFHKSTLLATLDEIELAALIPGKANIRELFPYYGVVMAFLCLSLFLTFCFETFYDETSDNSPESWNYRALIRTSDKITMSRVNMCCHVLLLIFLLLSGRNFITITNEDCPFGTDSFDMNTDDRTTLLCTALHSQQCTIASIVYPDSGIIKAYGDICITCAVLLFVGILIKPSIAQKQAELWKSRNARGRHRVLPDTVVIDFPQNRRSRRSRRRRRRGSSSHNGDDDDDDDDDDSRDSDDDVRMVTSSSGRGAGNGTITSLRISPAFVRQLSEVARRTRLSMGWKRLDRNPSFDLWNAKEGSNTDARHNEKEAESCTICLDPLFAQGSNSRDPGRYCFELECGHRFHNNCILTWTVSNSTCPICRKDLEKRK